MTAVDGASSMIDLARSRLGELADRVDFRLGDFRCLSKIVPQSRKFDVVLSSYALHHLNRDQKLDVIKQLFTLLEKGGWFINADIVAAEDPAVEEIIQRIRVEGIVNRARGEDHRFSDHKSTRRFLDELEAKEGDQPLSLQEDLKIMKKAGFENISCFWMEYREAVTGGTR